YNGTKEVAMPVTASTLTTVAVFLPLVFVEGIAGQLFRDQALTITFSLLASLGIALTVIPMLLSARFRTASELGVPPAPVKRSARPSNRFAAWGADAAKFATVDAPQVIVADLRAALRSVSAWALRFAGPPLSAFDRGIAVLEARYEKLLESSLNAKRAVLGGVLGAVLLAGITLQFLGGELIPPLSQGEFSFEVELPEGRPLE
ncbi:MAG: efflux RND transporter permease subunit, partial [Bryobacterales bacterium]|nr:efflux RND transporter permease subunit [Bryobacterales bacterium]